MSQEGPWWAYLNTCFRQFSPAQKKQFYHTLGVKPVTVQRWRNGTYYPHAAHVRSLLELLPEDQREHLRRLMLNDPKARALLPPQASTEEEPAGDQIPSLVYEEVLRLAREAPDRFWLLGSAILSHALSQLETHPQRTGLHLAIARCMPPRSDGKIRSLRLSAGLGTPPWRSDFHPLDAFLGTESLAGYAVMKRHGIMVPDLRDASVVVPLYPMEEERSAAASPILREGGLAGALIVSCHQTAFLTQERLTLIEHYADLLTLAFYDQEFYPFSRLDLALMPSWSLQQPFFASLRQRVTAEYHRSMREDGSFQALAQAEDRVRQTLEGEMLQLASRAGEGLPQR